jgi:hypothetical protein
VPHVTQLVTAAQLLAAATAATGEAKSPATLVAAPGDVIAASASCFEIALVEDWPTVAGPLISGSAWSGGSGFALPFPFPLPAAAAGTAINAASASVMRALST